MTKIFSRIALLALVIVVLATSCSKPVPKQTKYIPKDASFVFSSNPKRLVDKLSSSKIDLDSIMKAAFAEDTSMLLTSGDIASSGLDLSKDVFAFVQQSGSIMNGQSTTIGIVAAMGKQSDFEAFLKKKMPTVQIKKQDSYSYAVLKDGFVAGWNDEVVIYDNALNAGGESKDAGASERSLAILFAQKEDASIGSIPEFETLSKEKADMLLWSSSNSALASIPMMGMSKASDVFKDIFSASTINFEDGKVVMESKTYTNKLLTDSLKKYAGPKLDMDLVEKYPGAINGFAVFSFDPKVIVAILNLVGVSNTASQGLAGMGLTLDDVTKAFKGDFAVVVSGFGMTTKTNPEYPEYKMPATPSAKLLINAAIGDKAAYNKIMSKLAEKGLMVQKNGEYMQKDMAEGDADGFTMSTDAKNVIVASDSIILQQYKAGSGKAVLPQGVADQSKGNAVAFYVDIASILTAMPQDTTGTDFVTPAKQTFKDVIASSGNLEGNTVKGHAELRLVNDKENSLGTLTRYFGSMANLFAKIKKESGMDAGMMMPPTSDIDSVATMEEPKMDSTIK